MKYGLIGEKLGHSFSKEIHEKLADYTYDLLELSADELEPFLTKKEFSAINVTIPYKQAVMPFLDEISPQAKEIGAVNTIACKGNKLYGYNTDFLGMRALILRAKMNLAGKKVLILGNGGTARTARAVAKDLGAREILIVSRSGRGDLSYDEATRLHTDAQFIINTTPCGMFPTIHQSPIELQTFTALEGVVDAIYNPLRTQLISDALVRGIPAVGGLYMLVAQAAYAVEYFLDQRVGEDAIEAVFFALKNGKENLVLIGMPGCGKTTVGTLLAQKLNRPFYDTDQMFLETFQKTPDEMIRKEGEAAFRRAETDVVLSQASLLNGCVIATGGGVVLNNENIKALKMNGKTVFLDRPLELLAVSKDRPLSSNRSLLKKRYEERYDLYRERADIIISAADQPEALARQIIEEWKNEDSCYQRAEFKYARHSGTGYLWERDL